MLEHIPLMFEILGAFGLLLIAFYWFSRPVEKDRLMYGNKPFMLIVFMSPFLLFALYLHYAYLVNYLIAIILFIGVMMEPL